MVERAFQMEQTPCRNVLRGSTPSSGGSTAGKPVGLKESDEGTDDKNFQCF